MEYYEDEFLDFEQYAKQTGLRRFTGENSKESHTDFLLAKFASYEKWMKADRRREWQKYLKQQEKKSKKICQSEQIGKKEIPDESLHDKEMVQVRTFLYDLLQLATCGLKWFVLLCSNKFSAFCTFLQEVQSMLSQEVLSNNNEINAILLCLRKAISSTPYHKGYRSSNVKKINIDLPCTPTVFIQKFVTNVPLIKYSGESNYKCTVTASDLDIVFGTDWSSFRYRESSTRHQIIGLIIIHYRTKQVPTSATCSAFR